MQHDTGIVTKIIVSMYSYRKNADALLHTREISMLMHSLYPSNTATRALPYGTVSTCVSNKRDTGTNNILPQLDTL